MLVRRRAKPRRANIPTRIIGFSTGTLQLKPSFLEGSPAHGGPFGLIRHTGRDPAFTEPLPMWAWIIETATERILVDTGGAPGATGGVTRTRFHIEPQRTAVAWVHR